MPYEFFIEWLYPLPLVHKKMFGVDAFYSDEKIMCVLAQNDKYPLDKGIWIATKKEHHQQLIDVIPGVRPMQRIGIKKWLVLPEDHDAFEESAMTLATLIRSGSPLIGNIPVPKKKKLQN